MRLLVLCGVLAMSVVHTRVSLLGTDFNSDPVGSTLPAGWNKRAGNWDISNSSGARPNNLQTTDNVDDRVCEYTIGSAGRAFLQVRTLITSPSKFATPMIRFAYGAGSMDGYGLQVTSQTTIDFIKWVAGVKAVLHSFAAGINSTQYLIQMYVEDSVQQVSIQGLLQDASTFNSTSKTDTAHNGQNARTMAVRSGNSGSGGQSEFDDIAWTPHKILTVTGLPAGWKARILDLLGATVAEVIAPATTVSLSQFDQGSSFPDVPAAGWPTVQFINPSGTIAETYDEFPVYPGDTLAFTPSTWSPTLPNAIKGRELIIGAVEIHHPDADGTPRRYDWSGVAITERNDGGRHSEDRVLSFRDITVALSDRRTGTLQRSGFRILMSDRRKDRDDAVVTREWFDRSTGRTPRGAEMLVRLNSLQGILRGDAWFVAARGRLDRWRLGSNAQTELEALAWPFQRLPQPALKKTVADLFADAPSATRDRILQLVLGRRSDEPSATAAPVFVDDEAGRGGQGGADPLSSYGDIGLAAPTGLALSLNPGAGNAILGSHPNDEYYVFVAHVYEPSPGVFIVGDPEPFLPEDESILITANDDAIDAACDASADPDYYATRFYLGTRVLGAPQLAIQAHHYLETNDPVTGVTFDGLAPGTTSTGGVEAVNPAANLKRLARMADGRTVPSVRAHLVSVGYPRPVRMANDPVPSAIEYEDYIEYATGAFEWCFNFDPSHVNTNGDPYNTFNWSSAGATIVPAGIPTPIGKVTPIYCGGNFRDNNGVDGWGMALISARPCAEYFNGYFNGVQIPDAHYTNGEIRAPGRGNWSADFGPALYFLVSSHKFYPVFLRGYMLEAFLNGLGLADLTPDATIEGTDGTTTISAGGDSIDVTSVRNNLSDIDIVAAGSNTGPTASLSGSTLTIELGTDATLNDAASIAALLRTYGNEIRSAQPSDGSGTVTVQNAAFSGGTPDFNFVGNPWRPPFRVNVDGLGKTVGGVIGEGGGAETVITDPVELAGIFADNGVLDDPTVSEQNRLVSSRTLLTAPLTFADGTPRRDVDNFTQASLDLAALVVAGNVFGHVLNDASTHEAILADMARSGPFQYTFSLNGQMRLAIPNPTASAVAHIESRREVVQDSFALEATTDGYANAIAFRYNPAYEVDGSFEYASEGVADETTSQSRNDERVLDGLVLDMPWRDSEAAATRVAELLVEEQAYLPVTVQIDGGIHWVHRHPGDAISLTHPDGFGLAGWTEHMLRITGIRVEVDLIKTSLTCLDLRRNASTPVIGFLEKEDNDYLLKEDGDKIELE